MIRWCDLYTSTDSGEDESGLQSCMVIDSVSQILYNRHSLYKQKMIVLCRRENSVTAKDIS